MTTSALPDAQAPLPLPRDVISKLSPAPFLHAHLSSTPPVRPNGRSIDNFRTPSVNTSSLSHCSGSAVVRVGDTAVVCGVRAEILSVDNIPDTSFLQGNANGTAGDQDGLLSSLNLLVPNVELSTGCSPAHLPGSAPSALAQSLSYRVLRLLLSSRLIDIEDLRILHASPAGILGDDALESSPDASTKPTGPSTKGFWALHISLLVLSLSGPPFPALWGALVSALRDTRLPRAAWDADRNAILCSDRVTDSKALNLRGMPMASCWGVFRTPVGLSKKDDDDGEFWILADPDTFEEELCEELVAIVVDLTRGHLQILSLENGGGGTVGVTEMGVLIDQAGENWKRWDSVLSSARR